MLVAAADSIRPGHLLHSKATPAAASRTSGPFSSTRSPFRFSPALLHPRHKSSSHIARKGSTGQTDHPSPRLLKRGRVPGTCWLGNGHMRRAARDPRDEGPWQSEPACPCLFHVVATALTPAVLLALFCLFYWALLQSRDWAVQTECNSSSCADPGERALKV